MEKSPPRAGVPAVPAPLGWQHAAPQPGPELLLPGVKPRALREALKVTLEAGSSGGYGARHEV